MRVFRCVLIRYKAVALRKDSQSLRELRGGTCQATALLASLFRSVIPQGRRVPDLRGLGLRNIGRVIPLMLLQTEPPQAFLAAGQPGVIPQLRDFSSMAAGTHYVKHLSIYRSRL